MESYVCFGSSWCVARMNRYMDNRILHGLDRGGVFGAWSWDDCALFGLEWI